MILNELIIKNHTNFIDYFFIFPFWIGLIILLEILPYFLTSDILQIVSNFIFPNFKSNIRKYTAYLKIVLVSFFCVYVTFNVYIDTYKISESRFEIKINDLPSELYNLKLDLITDLQVDRFTQEIKLNSLKKLVNNDKPDLLFFAGDLVTRGTEFIDQGIDVMCNLPAKTERVACVGDHDYWSNAKKISTKLQKCGWTFLDNSHRIIKVQNKKILVTGITYVYSKRISSEQLTSILQKAPQADLKILLVHQPSKIVLKGAEEFNYDILLAGHTHGGQVVIRPFGFEITPTKFENEFYSGYYKKKNLNIFISNGVGLTMMPFRYNAPAEITKIILKK